MKKIHVALFDLLRKNWFLDNFRFCENVKNVKYVKFNIGLCHFLQISFFLAFRVDQKKGRKKNGVLFYLCPNFAKAAFVVEI